MKKVAIVGGGPVGLTLGLFLKKFNVPFCIFEKSDHISTHPKAHYVNSRSIEIFSELPRVYSSILEASEDISTYKRYRYQRRIFEKLGVYNVTDHFKFGERKWQEWIGLHCHKLPVHMPQNRLTSLLLKNLPQDLIQFSSEVSNVDEETGSFEIRKTKNGTILQDQADLVVIAEGFRSASRENLGIKLKGETSTSRSVAI